MKEERDCGQDGLGLVLAGGGAKGAYHVGVWKAVCESGLRGRVRAISGTSVGAVNGAAFASVDNPGEIERAWVDHIGDVVTPNFSALDAGSMLQAARNILSGKAFPFSGLLDRFGLERLIRKVLPHKWPSGAPDVFATALEVRGGVFDELNASAYRRRCFRINSDVEHERRIKMILASAAIPWGFDPVEVDGARFVDGGWDAKGGENVPVTPLLNEMPGIRTIVVVRCNGSDVEPESIRVAQGVELVEIRPRVTPYGILGDVSRLIPIPSMSELSGVPLLGNVAAGMDKLNATLRSLSATFAFSSAFAKKYMLLGYLDGMEALRPLRSKSRLKW